MAVNFPNMIFHRGMEVSGCYVAELDEKVVGMIAYAKKVAVISKKRIVLIRFGSSNFIELTAFDPIKEGFLINFDKQFRKIIEIYALFSFYK